MAIAERLIRLLRADLHGVMDSLENRELMLKQSLRDMESALRDKEEELRRMMNTEARSKRDLEGYEREIAELEEALKKSVSRGRDDLSRMLIRRIKGLEYHRDELAGSIEGLEERIAENACDLKKGQHEFEGLRLRSAIYLQDRRFSAEGPSWMEMTEDEIEMELHQYKEAVKGGIEK